jgi:RimJ/RimL family protein N-acetyltransferase
MLKGKNILLRPLQKSDLSLFIKWHSDPEVNEYLGRYLPVTQVMEEKWLEEAASTKGGTRVHFIIEAVNGNVSQPIGSIGLGMIDHRNQTAVMGIAIGEKDYWKKGYGTEAVQLLIDYGFKQLNLNRINSYVFAPNTRSLRMHEKVGFIKEGICRQTCYKNGRLVDEVVFGLLREEWRVQ